MKLADGTVSPETIERGRVGERLIRRYLHSRGSAMLPVCQQDVFKPDAFPRVYVADGRALIAPDFIGFNRKRVYWIEAKRKVVFTWYDGQWKTGIDADVFDNYVALREHGTPYAPLWVLFLQMDQPTAECIAQKGCPAECPTGLWGREIRALTALKPDYNASFGLGGMYFWRVRDLKKLATLEEVMAADASPAARLPLDIERGGAFTHEAGGAL
jgi:hypothetical protein